MARSDELDCFIHRSNADCAGMDYGSCLTQHSNTSGHAAEKTRPTESAVGTGGEVGRISSALAFSQDTMVKALHLHLPDLQAVWFYLSWERQHMQQQGAIQHYAGH